MSKAFDLALLTNDAEGDTMIIESVEVKNFRSILDETLHCEDLTALVGANGAGKSTFLRAIDLFYSASPRLNIEDFYDQDMMKDIVITIKFKDLSQEAMDRFSAYLQGGTLTVERVFHWDNGRFSSNYHGASLQNQDFAAVRKIDGAKEKKIPYESLRKDLKYANLPPWKNQADAMNSLREWEANNPEKCDRHRDDGQFFGFKEVGQGYLGRFTRFLFISAVRDAGGDAVEGKGSALTDLMDLVVRSVLAGKEEVKSLKEETQKKYKEIMDPTKLKELSVLAEQMTTTLRTFVPDATVELHWLPLEDINIPIPKADVKLNEDGYSSSVSRTGHGLQRAFILTMLQHLALAQRSSPATTEEKKSEEKVRLPNLVLAIEEPELYQHPNRQRHLAKILMQLAHGKTPGVAEKTQIIYGTHSPLFVGIDRIDQIRVLRKISHLNSKPKITKIVRTNLDKVAEVLWIANDKKGEKYTALTLFPRLQAIMTPWISEGFFAEVAVLVEGEDDYAAILGFARAMGHEPESLGLSIIPCGGKTCIDRPAAIFEQLGIPVYLVWDGDNGDKNANPEDNQRLLSLLGCNTKESPHGVYDRFAWFPTNLETTLREEIGPESFDEWLNQSQHELCIPKKKHALKNPLVIATIIQKAQGKGKTSPTLESIVQKMLALNPRTKLLKPISQKVFNNSNV